MKSVYLKLLRTELSRLEKRGGFVMSEKLLRSLEALFTKPEFKIVLFLERARLAYLVGRWDICLPILDKIEPQEALLEPDDRAYFYILNGLLHQGYGDLNQALTFLEIALDADRDDVAAPRVGEPREHVRRRARALSR